MVAAGSYGFIRHDPAPNGFRDIERREIVASLRRRISTIEARKNHSHGPGISWAEVRPQGANNLEAREVR
jgi:hypothetical protein